MKKILLSLFIHLFIPYYVFAGGVLFMAGGVESSGTTDLFNQNYETPTTGYDNGETWTEGGSYQDPVYTPALRGTQSLALGNQAGAGSGFVDSPAIAEAEIWGHSIVRFEGSFVANYFIQLRETDNTELFKIYADAGGQMATRVGSSFSTAGLPVLSLTTAYHIWFRFKVGNGTAESDVWVGTTSTRPGTADQSRTAQTAVGTINKLYLEGPSNATGFIIFDQDITRDSDFSTVDN